ncbi:hypothetical protein TOT_010000917 [Theileria orientalis strain Shintoku]|uniref:Uncharacterized protein n=1 Tax=Theileria orientalis strain Shintoku TaxID=869250 RepID=J4CCI7_THEOR|nr:hypothetical protein TOT_010000917 [Theileria orientalis strain Shintoku]PVC53991.1 hypothetical protein MACL_00003357 [Theileria orientalis]BAM39462.1 hypothetical protein TOT_010000917 [Theileria orientalis strain Shintoku]|eukprot:XP_009689763.1 hypothetical protein TOT_010000917 [Theileria orientalis strain Shintoku]
MLRQVFRTRKRRVGCNCKIDNESNSLKMVSIWANYISIQHQMAPWNSVLAPRCFKTEQQHS